MKVKPGLYLTKSGDLALVESRQGDGWWLGRLNFANVAWDASGEARMVSYDGTPWRLLTPNLGFGPSYMRLQLVKRLNGD